MYFKHKICVLWTHFFEFDFLSICISVYLGHPLSPTPTRAERGCVCLKPLILCLKPLILCLKPLICVQSTHKICVL